MALTKSKSAPGAKKAPAKKSAKGSKPARVSTGRSALLQDEEELNEAHDSLEAEPLEDLEDVEDAPKDTKGSREAKAKTPDFKAVRAAIDAAERASEAEIARATRSDIRETKRKLAEAPKTKWIVNLAPGERPGATIAVTINGYRLSIKKGVLVEIPVPVAELLAKHYNVQSDIATEKSMKLEDEALQAE